MKAGEILVVMVKSPPWTGGATALGRGNGGKRTGMKRVWPEEGWLQSWRYSYPYDLEEIYGVNSHLGYAYAYHHRREVILRLVAEGVSPGGRILDIGALSQSGSGSWCRPAYATVRAAPNGAAYPLEGSSPTWGWRTSG